MSTREAQGVSPDDAALEAEINTAALRFQTAGTIPKRRAAWAELQRLIASRSPEQIEWLEEQKGLRRP